MELSSADVPLNEPDTWPAHTLNEIKGFRGVIQEIVSRPGWTAGNAICIVGRGRSEQSLARRYVLSRDGDADHAPALEIKFRVP
jgi:hypothetical protein